ncbi:hypothetical protein ACOSP7_024266 [Xanthoceras sorbifolium]
MGRLNVTKCHTAKRGINASSFAALPNKAKVGEPNQGGQPPFLPPPPPISSTGNCSKGKWVAFDAATEQFVKKRLPSRSSEALILYEDFLTSALSQRIEEDTRMDRLHTLLRHTLMSASLAYKDMLETERNEAKRREMCDELIKARKELVVGAGREK